MEYNICNYCGAKDGRAGLLWNSPSHNIIEACENCYITLKDKVITIHSHLNRSTEELDKTIKLLERASWLVGNPGTNISSSTDLAADSWQKDYAELMKEINT